MPQAFYETEEINEITQKYQVIIYLIASVGVLITIVNLFLPQKKINKKLFKVQEDEPLDINYQQAEKDFDTDYDIENPATSREATLRRVQKMEGKTKIAELQNFNVSKDKFEHQNQEQNLLKEQYYQKESSRSESKKHSLIDLISPRKSDLKRQTQIRQEQLISKSNCLTSPRRQTCLSKRSPVFIKNNLKQKRESEITDWRNWEFEKKEESN